MPPPSHPIPTPILIPSQCHPIPIPPYLVFFLEFDSFSAAQASSYLQGGALLTSGVIALAFKPTPLREAHPHHE